MDWNGMEPLDPLFQDQNLLLTSSTTTILINIKVMKLKSMLREQAVYTEISGEETVESTSIPSLNKPWIDGNQQSNYLFNVDQYNPVSSQCWGVQLQLPSYP